MIDRLHRGHSAWIILGISLLLTLTAAWMSRMYARNSASERFDRRSSEVIQAIEQRLLLYEQSLLGGVGLFDASNEVSRDEFKAFVESLNIHKNLPGIQGYGFSQALLTVDREVHEATVRAEGFSDYSIWPKEKREVYSPVVFLEPFESRDAIGFDMWSDEVRQEAMARARDTGQAANSGISSLILETEGTEKGFLVLKCLTFCRVQSCRVLHSFYQLR